MTFGELADFLRQGREIEFSYKGREYAITNHSGLWYLTGDTEHVILCRFEEKDVLVSETAGYIIDGITVKQIFDMQAYDEKSLCIL